MPLKIHNSLTRTKEEFRPLDPAGRRVGIYVCGPTVYGPAHLGHAKSYVGFDVVVRWLRHSGFQVRYVQNITDVGHLVSDADEGEDKIAKEARLRGLEPMEVAERWTREYFEDMDALGVLRPDISPRATGHIPEQIEIVETLVRKGYAYEAGGSVYFDVAKWPEYGKLSGRRVEEAETGTRVAVKEEKRHPADFALWKKAEPGHIMRWNSPWGVGFPGWHIECSAMSMKYLGETFDIHGGGQDNRFPHHEDEVAQSEAATGKPFARYWMHNGLVTINGQKMGKSLGNYISLKELFGELPLDEKRKEIVKITKAYDPLVVRFLILQNHYGSNLDISEENLEAARKALTTLLVNYAICREFLANAQEGDAAQDVIEVVDHYRQSFAEAMDNDFNTSAAIGETNKFLARLLERGFVAGKDSKASLSAIVDAIATNCGKVLGIVPEEMPPSIDLIKLGIDALKRTSDGRLNHDLIHLAVEARGVLRSAGAGLGKLAKKKDAPPTPEVVSEAAKGLFDASDALRKKLADLGIVLEDTPKGTVWKLSK
jgi:cysteinyl-tRNA synthetase